MQEAKRSRSGLDPTTWWDTIADQIDTPLRDLIDGLDEIAEQTIPYGWLPGRARTFYGAQYATWSDLADETITSRQPDPDRTSPETT